MFTLIFLFCAGDLWGPLLVCLLLSTTLSFTAPSDSTSLVFATVFVVVWAGAVAVTLNAQLLGGSISFFQSVCILGYCVFPLTLAALGCLILKAVYMPVQHSFLITSRRLCYAFVLQTLLKFAIVGLGFIWSTKGK
jgi:hypothetical protein